MAETVGSHNVGCGSLVLCRQDDLGWLEVVRKSPDATAFHHPAWSAAVTETYGYPAFVLAWRLSDARVVGGLPVIEVSNPIGRPRLVSLPFTDHCPPVFEAGVDQAQFTESILRWRGSLGDHSMEVRAGLQAEGVHSRTVGTRHVMALEPDSELVFRRLHRNRIQKRIRRSREAGVEVTLTRSRDELATFYRLHCETRRRQGVPVQPRRFIERLWRTVVEPGLGFVITARIGGVPIATALFLCWNQHLIYKYGASDRSRWNLGANFLVHWTAIEWGCANGCKTYDLGRTDAGHESLRAFKAGWGAEEIPLIYTHIGSRAPKLEGGRAPAVLGHLIRHSPTLVCRVLGEVLYKYAA
jgi:CelD/BcsL family acetyltransferase involved in cellulose biosynthesis